MPRQKKVTESEKKDIALEDVMLALQKSFSRVNRDTAQVDDDEARAMIIGEIEFQMVISVSPVDNGETSWLKSDPEGGINLSLNGKIDMGIEEKTEENTP